MTNIGLVFLFICIGAVGAYFTNFQGFKEWVDTYILSAPAIIGGDDDEEPRGESLKKTAFLLISNGFDTKSMH